MKTVSCLFVFLFVSISVTCLAIEWSEHKSDHFIIQYHPDISIQYVREFTRKCERYYDRITHRLGFNRFDFWLWDDRANVYIHKTREDYLEDSSQPGWSGGSVNVKTKSINTFYLKKDFFDIVLPHELSHIILREFVGIKTAAPLWFDEGTASLNEEGNRAKFLAIAKKAVKAGEYIPLEKLERMTHSDIKNPALFYSIAASLAAFLLEKHPKSDFVAFCRELRDGTRFYEAMRKIYKIENSQALEKKFLEFLK